MHILAHLQIAHDAAACGHLDPARAGHAAQLFFELLFKPVLADLVTRCDQQRVGVLLVFLGRRRPDVADQVADARGGRVEPREAALGEDAGKFGKAHAQGGEILVAQAACDLDGLEPARGFDLVLDIGNPRRLEPEQFAQPVDGGLGIDQTLGDQVDPEIRAVGGERCAVAVEDPAAARRNKGEVDAVAFGFETIFLVLRDRQIAQPQRQQHPDPALDRADHHRAPLERGAQQRGVDHLGRFLGPALEEGDLHQSILRARERRKRSSPATIRAIMG